MGWGRNGREWTLIGDFSLDSFFYSFTPAIAHNWIGVWWFVLCYYGCFFIFITKVCARSRAQTQIYIDRMRNNDRVLCCAAMSRHYDAHSPLLFAHTYLTVHAHSHSIHKTCNYLNLFSLIPAHCWEIPFWRKRVSVHKATKGPTIGEQRITIIIIIAESIWEAHFIPASFRFAFHFFPSSTLNNSMGLKCYYIGFYFRWYYFCAGFVLFKCEISFVIRSKERE